MKHLIITYILLFFYSTSMSQVIEKPRGCFAGTNGTYPSVLSHPEARGVLITVKWPDIELSPGVFDFTNINNKILDVKNANLKYSLAIPAGAFGSPNWLIDSLGASYFSFTFHSQNWRLPLWWDSVVEQRLNMLITELGIQYAQDTSLSHIYVPQMSTNGIGGHLNGINMSSFNSNGFTN